MNRSLETNLHLWGFFLIHHAQQLPLLHKQHWTPVSRICSEFQQCMYRVEGERTASNCQKECADL